MHLCLLSVCRQIIKKKFYQNLPKLFENAMTN